MTDTNERQARQRFGRMVLFLIASGFAAVLVAGLFTLYVLTRGETEAAMVSHTYEVERRVTTIRLSLEEMRSTRRGHLIGLVGSRQSYDEASARMFAAIDQTRRLTVDNPRQQTNVTEVAARARRLDTMFRQSIALAVRRDETTEARIRAAGLTVQQMADDMLQEEQRLLAIREADQRNSIVTLYAILALAAVLLLIVGAGSIWTIRRYTDDLNASRDALQSLNENLEEAVAERTTDLQRANDEIQRFAYIVSHDLRSPLVNVMGFTAELEATIKPLDAMLTQAEAQAPDVVTEDAKLAVREDLPEAIGFIRTSTQKMDRLINAILRLSREGRKTLSPAPLDLGDIAQGVVDVLRHRIDELGVDISIARPMPHIVTDRLAIEQILSNLVENAVKYLKVGRPGVIAIRAHSQPGRVIIEVADNGRGIETRDHERIFDLFRRSGAQDQPGEGIGLAHVRALAYRIGGTIAVESELDKGATFRISLPAVFTGERGLES